MKLTTVMRDAFVRAAMADVPSEDFREQRQQLLQAYALETLPPKVRALYDDKTARDYLTTRYMEGSSIVCAHGWKPPAAVAKKLDAINALAEAQTAKRRNLESTLRNAAHAYSTRKALADALPEFAKYLPADTAAANRQVPVIANIVADFTKAGWPKGKKPTKTKQPA